MDSKQFNPDNIDPKYAKWRKVFNSLEVIQALPWIRESAEHTHSARPYTLKSHLKNKGHRGHIFAYVTVGGKLPERYISPNTRYGCYEKKPHYRRDTVCLIWYLLDLDFNEKNWGNFHRNERWKPHEIEMPDNAVPIERCLSFFPELMTAERQEGDTGTAASSGTAAKKFFPL